MSAVPNPAPDDSWEVPEVPPGIRRSQEAFWRDLPQLLPLRSRKRLWVAYHGDAGVVLRQDTGGTVSRNATAVGSPETEFYVGRLEPDHQPPWETEDMDDWGELPDGATEVGDQ